MTTIVAGVDLAWSEKNTTGIVLLNDTEILCAETVQTLKEIKELLDHYKPRVIGVDAPLRVPNKTGNRKAEQELNKVFKKFDAGCHPVNRTILTTYATIPRGEELRILLKEYRASPYTKELSIIEVYPHAATIRLLKLNKIFKYKRGTITEKKSELKKLYQALEQCTPPPPKINFSLKGKAYKAQEDILDAYICALVAREHLKGNSEVFGDEIVVPKEK